MLASTPCQPVVSKQWLPDTVIQVNFLTILASTTIANEALNLQLIYQQDPVLWTLAVAATTFHCRALGRCTTPHPTRTPRRLACQLRWNRTGFMLWSTCAADSHTSCCRCTCVQSVMSFCHSWTSSNCSSGECWFKSCRNLSLALKEVAEPWGPATWPSGALAGCLGPGTWPMNTAAGV